MWDEDKHPRDNSGKFTDKQGSTGYSKEHISRVKEKNKIYFNRQTQSKQESYVTKGENSKRTY